MSVLAVIVSPRDRRNAVCIPDTASATFAGPRPRSACRSCAAGSCRDARSADTAAREASPSQGVLAVGVRVVGDPDDRTEPVELAGFEGACMRNAAAAAGLGEPLDRGTRRAQRGLFVGGIDDCDRDVRLAVESLVLDRDEEDHRRPALRALLASTARNTTTNASAPIAANHDSAPTSSSHAWSCRVIGVPRAARPAR